MSESTMKNWIALASLDLLDDSQGFCVVPKRLQRGIREQLATSAVRTAARTAAVASAATRTAAAPVPSTRPARVEVTARPASAPASGRVFRSQPSLRQMLEEYNGRASRLSPLKGHSTRPAAPSPSAQAPSSFRFERVQHVEVAAIAGKILRPSPHG